jgi:16S rRNA (cytidine1402-2'-O)-methyltransferase
VVDVVEKATSSPSAHELAAGLVEGYPLIDEIRLHGQARLSAAISAVAAAIRRQFGDAPVRARITALVASGLPTDGFVFLGFLRRKPGKMKKELLGASSCGKTIVFYESPHRIKKTISLCREVFPSSAQVVIARELTKKFEEFMRGTLDEVDRQVQSRDMMGEIVVLVAPQTVNEEKETEQEMIDEHD